MMIPYPLPGLWYITAGQPWEDEAITQKGLVTRCYYTFNVVLNTTKSSYKPTTQLIGNPVTMDMDPSAILLNRVFITQSTLQAKIEVTCFPTNASSCNLHISARSQSVPIGSDTHIRCMSQNCFLTVPSPVVNDWLYVKFINLNQVSATSVISDITLKECNSSLITPHCTLLSPLEAVRGIDEISTKFGRFIEGVFSSQINVTLTALSAVVVPFTMEQVKDVGGTLSAAINIYNKTTKLCNATVTACLSYSYINYNSTDCNMLLTVNKHQVPSSLYVPYPQHGHWFVTFLYSCQPREMSCCDEVNVRLSLISTPCVDNECKNNGMCQYYDTRSWGIYTACKCISGWQGYDCTDDTHADSSYIQLVSILLLTLSNLAFIPAVVIAIKRKFYAEAVVYFATMLFSALYHACDVDNIYRYCVTKFNTLSFCDFFSSVMALWVTTVAVNEHGPPWQPLLHLTGVMFLQFGVLYARHSLWVLLVPGISGIAIVFITWGCKCRKSRKCYPDTRRYWFRFIPGCMCALIGVSLFSFVETTSNYRYTHSCWHILMATCIPLVLPDKPPWIGRSRGSCHSSGKDSSKTVNVKDQESILPTKKSNLYVNKSDAQDGESNVSANVSNAPADESYLYANESNEPAYKSDVNEKQQKNIKDGASRNTKKSDEKPDENDDKSSISNYTNADSQQVDETADKDTKKGQKSGKR